MIRIYFQSPFVCRFGFLKPPCPSKRLSEISIYFRMARPDRQSLIILLNGLIEFPLKIITFSQIAPGIDIIRKFSPDFVKAYNNPGVALDLSICRNR